MSCRLTMVTVRPLCLLCALLTGLVVALAIPGQADDVDDQRLVIGPAGGDAIQVMSFNLRYASDAAPNSWPQRRPAMAELLRVEQPTVIGTQEGLYEQLNDLQRDLPDYFDRIGEGRAGGTRDEFTAIFYDTRRLRPLEDGRFWLSDTPAVIGSKTWGNRTIRMATWARFADNRTGIQFVVFDTHLDNLSEQSRTRSAELLRDRINAVAANLPVILTGDFNAPATTSTPYGILTSGAGLTDTWLAAAHRRTPEYSTFHGYRPPVPHGARIDWILTRGARAVSAAAINTFARDGQFPSDHFPVQALITIG